MLIHPSATRDVINRKIVFPKKIKSSYPQEFSSNVVIRNKSV